ncbi:cytidylate kinase family protein [Agathobaculum massiliense]|uniref:cytidylate kinase family protein n=1 Tax=Agathobaculum massiliense TaxID=3014267 RepID=UPI000D1E936E|nr:cytidylate kinase family protein [Agathobaculum massiliense]
MEKIIVTVGWWFGSRGREIEKKIAQKLRIPYYDKKLLVVVAKESGLALNFLQDMDEKHPYSLLHSLCLGQPNLEMGNCSISVELQGTAGSCTAYYQPGKLCDCRPRCRLPCLACGQMRRHIGR